MQHNIVKIQKKALDTLQPSVIVLVRTMQHGGENLINSNRLKGIIAERGLSQRKVAHMLGITEKTFYDKIKKGVFDSDEMAQMISILEIVDPISVFFANSGTRDAT